MTAATYTNPVIHADYSDPDAIRVGDTYYLTASSFNCTPGLPILKSTDLVTWTLVNHALARLPYGSYDLVRPGCGVWAPAIREHGGKFWIFWPTPDEGIHVSVADHPEGTWSEPWVLLAGKGLIDPCPYWDDDGRAWLVHAYANSRAGQHSKLHLRPMAPDCRSLLGAGQIVFEDPIHHPTLEGPKIYRKDGWYYIFAPAGSVHGGWQTVMRSRQITGPYEARIVLEQGATPINGPHQGALIDTPSGQWWFLHFQSLAPYGRIVHLQPVAWHDGWPVIGQDRTGTGIGEPVLTHPRPDLPPAPLAVIPTSDDFRSPRLGLQWQWQANHQPHWYSLTARPGSLRLFPQPAPVGKPEQIGNLVAQKFHALSFRVVTAIEDHDFTPTDRAGLALTGGQPAGLFLARDGQERRVELVIDGGIKGSLPVGDGLVYLRFDVHEGGHVRFWLRCGNGPWQGIFVVAHALMGNWVGAKFGLTAITAGGAATSAYADVRGFVVGTLNDDPDSLAAHIPKT